MGLELAGQDQPHASRTPPTARLHRYLHQRYLRRPHWCRKSHLAIALGYAACLRGHSVLFAAAIDVVNRLSAAESSRQLAREMHYQSPKLLLIDELGYLHLDKRGAELLFQIITKRYERGSIIITTNIAFKDWPRIFAGDATMTSALLDRLLHHAQPVVIEGDSYRSAKRKTVSSHPER
jgi:DNA replication protein DnaC